MEYRTNISDVKKTIKESVRIYLAKDEKGNYLMPQNKQRPLFLLGPAGSAKQRSWNRRRRMRDRICQL